MKTFDGFGNYLETLENHQRFELERIRKIVREVVPEAIEVISYGMPGYKYKNKYLVGFGAFKNHLSLFPTSKPVEVLKNRLNGFDISKGTIRFSVDNPLPKEIIVKLLKVRLADISAI
jgi:uncharacterized protein YdhG (YjbR/CyaY superfamily)